MRKVRYVVIVNSDSTEPSIVHEDGVAQIFKKKKKAKELKKTMALRYQGAYYRVIPIIL